ncbi:MAG: ABC transporter substrate-binding protein [Betaproteobacteria bacterium]|jgi:ABC-type transport system substrate-binding protein
MSPPGRPKGEFLSAQREGNPVNPPGRPKGEFLSAQREANPVNPLGRPKGESLSAQREGSPMTAPRPGSTAPALGTAGTRQRRALLKAGALAAAGLTNGPALAQKSGAKVLRYAFEQAEVGFDPAQLSDLYSRIITAHIYEGLYGYDHLARPYKIRPVTAVALPEVSDNFRRFLIRVKPGIFFQDDPVFKGKPRELVAEDYVYSIKRFADPRWKAPAYASVQELRIIGLHPLREAALKNKTPFDYDTPIEGMRALDRYTLEFRLEQPSPRSLVQVLATPDLWGAVAREVIEAAGDKTMERPVGTGPFRLAAWTRSARVVLERNPTYREVRYDAEPNADDAEGQALLARFKGQRLPMVDRVEISIIDEQQPRWLSFLDEQHDLLERLPFEFINLAAPNGRVAPGLAARGIQMSRSLNSDVFYTFFNMDDPVVGGMAPERVALRRAIGLAIDIDQEIRLFWRGQAIPAQSPLAPHTSGYDPRFTSESGQYDLPRARALLDTFGYVDRNGDGWREQPDGTPLVLQWATTPDQRARSRDELRRKDMDKLGLRVEFKTAKFQENLKNARAGKLAIWTLGANSASPDGLPALDRGSSNAIGGQNMARFRDERFDRIYTELRQIPDGPEREKLFFEAKRLLAAYAPYKVHVHRILTDFWHPWLHGYRRPLFWQTWWQYVDIDVQALRKAVG